MQIILNGRKKHIESNCNLIELLKKEGYSFDAMAIAINQTVIPTHQYHQIQLQDGMEIEIVAPMQGG